MSSGIFAERRYFRWSKESSDIIKKHFDEWITKKTTGLPGKFFENSSFQI